MRVFQPVWQELGIHERGPIFSSKALAEDWIVRNDRRPYFEVEEYIVDEVVDND